MKASDYINYLVNGETYKLAIQDVGDMAVNGATPSTLQTSNRTKFINYLNLANLAIHKRFHLLQRQYEIDHPIDNEDYVLPDDFLAPIYAYYNDNEKVEIPIKDTYRKIVDNVDTAVSLLIPEPFKVTVKGTDTAKGTTQIILVYAASPTVITKVTQSLNISNVYTEAVLNYAAYKAYSAISGDIKAENNSYYLRYESNCRQVIASGLGGDNETETNSKLEDNGFI